MHGEFKQRTYTAGSLTVSGDRQSRYLLYALSATQQQQKSIAEVDISEFDTAEYCLALGLI